MLESKIFLKQINDDSFSDEIIHELKMNNAHVVNENGGSVDHLKINEFQKDSIIAHLIISQKCDLIFANNSDIHLLTGRNVVQLV